MIGATSGAGTAYPSEALMFTCIFSGVCVDRSLVFCFVDRCFSFFFWQVHSLSFYLWLLITSSASSNFSYKLQ